MDKAKEVARFVSGRIASIEKSENERYRTAILAQLRRGVGRGPGEIPQLWGILLQALPEEMMGRGKEPSYEEWAIYTALTLYAFHQQGMDPTQESMNVEGRGIGSAAAKLIDEEEDLIRLQNRFNRFALAEDRPQIETQLRGLVSMLRSHKIGLDYPLLASQLYRYQFHDNMSGIRLAWGRDFYRTYDHDFKEDTEK